MSEESEEVVEAKAQEPVIAPPNRSEERHRLVAIIAAVPVVYLCSPGFLPLQGRDSLLQKLWREPALFACLVGVMVWPVLIGLAALVRGIKGSPPGRFLFGVPAVVLGLMSFALSGLLIVAVLKNGGAGGEPVIWLVLGSSLGAVFSTVRGFFRAGFRRFNHLLAATWFLSLAAMFAMWSASPSLFRTPIVGLWLYCAINAMLLPLFVYAFLPRKKEEA